MSSDQQNTIYPCPFSKNYGIPIKQAWLLLRTFYIYRFTVANLFVVLFFSSFSTSVLGSHNSQLYIIVSIIYLSITLLSFPFVFWRLASYVSQAQIFIFTDIIIITLLMHSCGGVTSGIGILLAISIAASGLLIGGRCAMLLAALASLAVLAEQIYAIQANAFPNTAFTYSGILGASFFTIAFLSYVLAKRTEQSELLSNQRKQTITRLEELNQYIIQHLQSGIIICNQQQQIQLSNEATQRILGIAKKPTQLSDIDPQLLLAFDLWQDTNQDFAIIELANGEEIQTRFSLFDIQDEAYYFIIFEDIALYNQRLQQNKLAALGRLTASIAHEIRNPLSAISHAGQLLSEAPELTDQDKRLTEIIQNHSQRINNIIEDILNLSRRTPSKKEKILLNQWLPEFVDSITAEQGYHKDRIDLQITNDSLNVLIDSDHLGRIINNLCSNGLKYGCTENENIIIKAGIENGSPSIQIIDNGSGIETDIQKHLFEPFFTTSSSGTGLGLYISRELAELNQAKLSYDIKNNKSCFSLLLPKADQAIIEI